MSSIEPYEPTQAEVQIRDDRRPHKSRTTLMARSYAQVVAEGIPRVRDHLERKPPMDDYAGEHNLKYVQYSLQSQSLIH